MGDVRAWKYRIYPSKRQQEIFDSYLHFCKDVWNGLLEYAKEQYQKAGKFPNRRQLYLRVKDSQIYSQVAQNVADRLTKALRGMLAKKNAGLAAGFPRFKSIERMKSFTYPQFGFKLNGRLELSGIGSVSIKKHRTLEGKIKTLTIKKSPSGKWFAIFTSELDASRPKKKEGPVVGIDIGVENFAYLSDGDIIENPRHLKKVENRLKREYRWQSRKRSRSKNRRKARLTVAIAYEKLTNRRRDFLHKVSRRLVDKYSFIALENLNVAGLARSILAKSVLDCSWAEFADMLRHKAESAGCEVVMINPANTSQMCSSCGLIRKKSLAERWHSCPCGASMHRDLNAAINILERATLGHRGSNAWGEDSNSFLTEPRIPDI